jgi:hypothetical protein
VTRNVTESPRPIVVALAVTVVDHPFLVNTGAEAPCSGSATTPTASASVIRIQIGTDRSGR